MGYHSPHRRHTQQKEGQIKAHRTPAEGRRLSQADGQRSMSAAEADAQQEQQGRARCIGRGESQKLRKRQAGQGKQVEVLRVPYGGEHTAQIGRHGHQSHGEAQPFPLAGHLQHHHAQGDKGDEGHVVGDQHTAHKAQEHQGDHQAPHRPRPGEHPGGHILEELFLPQPLHQQHQTEQSDQSVEIDIVQIARPGGLDQTGEHRQAQRDGQHRISPEPPQDPFSQGLVLPIKRGR